MNHWLSKLASIFVLALVEEKLSPLNFSYFSTQISQEILVKQSITAKKNACISLMNISPCFLGNKKFTKKRHAMNVDSCNSSTFCTVVLTPSLQSWLNYAFLELKHSTSIVLWRYKHPTEKWVSVKHGVGVGVHCSFV